MSKVRGIKPVMTKVIPGAGMSHVRRCVYWLIARGTARDGCVWLQHGFCFLF